jgi:hypothetical protein
MCIILCKYSFLNRKLCNCIEISCEPGSSVSIVSGCGMDVLAIEVRSPAEARGFFV